MYFATSKSPFLFTLFFCIRYSQKKRTSKYLSRFASIEWDWSRGSLNKSGSWTAMCSDCAFYNLIDSDLDSARTSDRSSVSFRMFIIEEWSISEQIWRDRVDHSNLNIHSHRSRRKNLGLKAPIKEKRVKIFRLSNQPDHLQRKNSLLMIMSFNRHCLW